MPPLSLTIAKADDEREPDKRPLDLGLILRLLRYMRPYALKRNLLLVCVAETWMARIQS